MTPRVSFAELAAAGIQLRPPEAAAVADEICRRCIEGALPGIPPAGVIRLTRYGEIAIEGPMTTGDEVTAAAHLLADLLAGHDAPAEYRASGSLQLLVARAIDAQDGGCANLDDFRAALQPFVTVGPREAARSLFHAWERACSAADLRRLDRSTLTISDIRRARRATGLTLEEVAAVAEVPATQLRELEWGYMRNWRADKNGRVQLIRYARATGLDEALVLAVAWPMIQDAEFAGAPPEPAAALVPAPPASIARIAPRKVSAWRARAGWIAAAVAVLLAAVITGLSLANPPSAVRAPATVAAAPAVTTIPPRAGTQSAAPMARNRTASAAAKRAPAPRTSRRVRPPNLLDREIIRFVFR